MIGNNLDLSDLFQFFFCFILLSFLLVFRYPIREIGSRSSFRLYRFEISSKKMSRKRIFRFLMFVENRRNISIILLSHISCQFFTRLSSKDRYRLEVYRSYTIFQNSCNCFSKSVIFVPVKTGRRQKKSLRASPRFCLQVFLGSLRSF